MLEITTDCFTYRNSPAEFIERTREELRQEELINYIKEIKNGPDPEEEAERIYQKQLK